MIINNTATRLKASAIQVSRTREAERQRVKNATRSLRTYAEKLAWHLAECRRAGGVAER